jgi:uncharacterized protein YecT (DUF1311 family)
VRAPKILVHLSAISGALEVYEDRLTVRKQPIYLCIALGLLVNSTALEALPAADPCGNYPSSAALNHCVQQQFAAQDRRLNEAYQKLLLQLDSATRQTTRDGLVKAQRLWVQFRDTDCRAQESVFAGGPVHTWVYLRCLRDHTAQRVKDLDPLNWQGG